MNKCVCGIDTEHKYCSDECYKRAKAQRHRSRNPLSGVTPSVTPLRIHPPEANGAFNRGYCKCGKDSYFGDMCVEHYTEAITRLGVDLPKTTKHPVRGL